MTYTFGTTPAQFNNGRLITLITTGVETDTFTYDLLGRTTSASKNITGAKTYNLTYAYNLGNEVSTLTYPSGRVVTQNYDAIGRLSQLNDGVRTYANQFSYNPAQQVLGYSVGNGVQGTFGYSSSLLQLQTLNYVKGANTLFSLSYGYTQPNGGNNGQITSITDNVTSANNLTFTYDALGRLTRGVTGSLIAPNTWDIGWGYDRYGNRTSQTENGGTLAVTNSNLTFNTHNQPTGGFSFDLSGNTLDDAVTHNYVYDGEGRYVKLGTTTVNTYDGGGLRMEKVTSGNTTVYVFAGANVVAEYTPSAQTTAPTKEYVYLGGQLLATLDASGNPTYRHPDHLSARLLADDGSGTVIGTEGHLPFGENWYSTGTLDKWKFTSYERDTDTSLDYAEMRFDSGRLARFTSPDPFSGSISVGNPQTWNRYAFVINDPTNLTDPSGLCPRGNVNCILAHNNDDLSFMGFSRGCYIYDIPVPCAIANDLLWSGAGCLGVVCDGNDSADAAHAALPGRLWVPAGCITTSESTQYGPVPGSGGSSCQNGYFVSVANNSSWAWTYTKSFFGGFTLSSSCYGAAVGSLQPVVGAVYSALDYTKKAAPYVNALPSIGAAISNTISGARQYGADKYSAQFMAGLVTAGTTSLYIGGNQRSTVLERQRQPQWRTQWSVWRRSTRFWLTLSTRKVKQRIEDNVTDFVFFRTGKSRLRHYGWPDDTNIRSGSEDIKKLPRLLLLIRHRSLGLHPWRRGLRNRRLAWTQSSVGLLGTPKPRLHGVRIRGLPEGASVAPLRLFCLRLACNKCGRFCCCIVIIRLGLPIPRSVC